MSIWHVYRVNMAPQLHWFRLLLVQIAGVSHFNISVDRDNPDGLLPHFMLAAKSADALHLVQAILKCAPHAGSVPSDTPGEFTSSRTLVPVMKASSQILSDSEARQLASVLPARLKIRYLCSAGH